MRVHTDADSQTQAADVGARAYAVGQDIHFGSGEYQPGTPAGDQLIAHEVVHTVQQRGAEPVAQHKLKVSEAGDSAEREADALAGSIVSGQPTVGVQNRIDLGIHRTPHSMRPDAARPERTSIQITGRYEALDPGTGNRITMEINQAGTHFEGWWQRREMRSSAHMDHQRIVGDKTADTPTGITFSYQRFHEGGQNMPGTLTASGSGATYRVHCSEGSGNIVVDDTGQMQVEGWNHDFRRTSETPRLSQQGIDSLPAGEVRDMALASENAPLDSAEEARLHQATDVIMSRIRDWLDASAGVARDANASGLNSAVQTVFHNHPAEQHALVRQRLHEYLVTPNITSGSINRPYWDWLQVIVATSPSYTAQIQALLGMSATGFNGDANAPQNQYSWNFTIVGLAGDVGVGLGGFLGRFQIQQTGGAAIWTTNYFTVLGQVSGGLSAGVTVGMHTSNTLQSPFPWRSGNFRGAYSITGGAVGAAAIGGATEGAGFINFFGDGTFPAVSGGAGGLTVLAGAYIGAEASETGGYLWGGQDEAIQYARQHQARQVTGVYQATANPHFAVDDPSLTPAGWQALRETCALQRAMLVNQLGSIHITGFASPAGSDAHNMTLSQMRARNTLQAIRDIMGPDLAIPPFAQASEGRGEGPARAAGIPNGQESDAWRKVEVAFDGTVVLTLRF